MSALLEPLHFSASKKNKVNSHWSCMSLCQMMQNDSSLVSLTCFTCSNKYGRSLTRAFMFRNSFMYSLVLCRSATLHEREDYILSCCGKCVWLLWCESQRLKNTAMNCVFWPGLTYGALVFHYSLLSSCCVGPAALHGGKLSSSWPGISFGNFAASRHSLGSYYPSSPLTFCKSQTIHQSIQIFVSRHSNDRKNTGITQFTWWLCSAS